MLKRYYTLKEASDYLSSEHKIRISERDILDLAACRKLRVCTWFNGTLAPFLTCIDSLPDDAIPSGPPLTFRGYIQISRFDLAPNKSKFESSVAGIVEVIDTASDMSKAEEENPAWPWFYTACSQESDSGALKQQKIQCDLEDLLVPAIDLLELSPLNSVRLPVTSPSIRDTSFISIIAAMLAAWPKGKLPTGKDLEKAGQSVGVSVSDDTIRKALSSARAIAPGLPKSK